MIQRADRHCLVLVALLGLAVGPYLVGLGDSSLWDANEAFYAETPREMIASGDYIHPTFNFQPRLNKPPLSYWLVVLSYKLFGVSEYAERLAIAAGALTMIATAGLLGWIVYSGEAGLLAAIALAATPRFLMFARRILIDISISAFMGLTLLFFVLAEQRPNRRRTYLVLMYVAIGLGMLTKGPVALVLPALSCVAYLAATRRLGTLRDVMAPTGALIVAAVVIPWYAALYASTGWTSIQSFVVHENIARFTESIGAPPRGWFFYPPVVLGDLFPWSFFLIFAIVMMLWPAAGGRAGNERGTNPSRLLLIWTAVIVGFFTLSRTKQDLYILPMAPAAAALVGGALARGWTGTLGPRARPAFRWTAAGCGASLMTLGAIVLYVFDWRAGGLELAGATAVGAAAVVGGVGVIAMAGANRPALAIIGMALTLVVAHWMTVIWTLPDFERYKPVPALSRVINRAAGPADLIGHYRLGFPSLVYYVRRPIFEFYAEAQLRSAFSSGRGVYCLMTSEDYDRLCPSLQAPIHVLAARPVFDVRLSELAAQAQPRTIVLVSNRPPTGGGRD